jgi:hypothetical protein
LTTLRPTRVSSSGCRTESARFFCRVSHEALRDLADRVHFEGTDEKLFEAYRELIEQVASDAYDAGTSIDDAGLVLVTSEALARVGRSA